MRLSLRWKWTALFAGFAVVACLLLTGFFAYRDQTERRKLARQLTETAALNAAGQLRARLEQASDRVRLFVIAQLSPDSARLLPSALLRDSAVTNVQVFRKEKDSFLELRLVEGLPVVGAARTALVPFLADTDRAQNLVWSTADKEGGVRLYLGTRVELEKKTDDSSGKALVVVADLDAKPFFESLQSTGFFHTHWLNQKGEPLISVERGEIKSPAALATHPLAKEPPGTEAAKAREYEFAGRRWQGTLAGVGFAGLRVLEEVSQDELKASTVSLVRRAGQLGGILVTLALFVGLFFAWRMTRDLRRAREALAVFEAYEGGTLPGSPLDSGKMVTTETSALAETVNRAREKLREWQLKGENDKGELRSWLDAKGQELQQADATIRDLQEKVLGHTQMAGVGEAAARTSNDLAHPVAAVLSRLERCRKLVKTDEPTANHINQFSEILAAWETEFRDGGIERLVQTLGVPSRVRPEISLFEEDLENLKLFSMQWKKEHGFLREDLDFIQDQTVRIQKGVDKVRELARQAMKEDTHCHDGIRQAIESVEEFLATHHIQLHRELKAENDVAHVNRTDFQQMIHLLFKNAFQAIEAHPEIEKKNSGVIQIRTSSLNHLFLIDMIDNGVAISEESRRRLFEDARDGKTSSTLPTCRRLARTFGGEIELMHSEPEGRGNCYRITVPLKRGTEPLAEPPSSEALAS